MSQTNFQLPIYPPPVWFPLPQPSYMPFTASAPPVSPSLPPPSPFTLCKIAGSISVCAGCRNKSQSWNIALLMTYASNIKSGMSIYQLVPKPLRVALGMSITTLGVCSCDVQNSFLSGDPTSLMPPIGEGSSKAFSFTYLDYWGLNVYEYTHWFIFYNLMLSFQ